MSGKSKINSGLFSNKSDIHGTPAALFKKLDKEFGFSIDLCANKNNAKCPKFYDEKTDGLSKIWRGVCWLNPPYSNNAAWIKKAYEETKNGNADVVVCLIPGRVDTRYWHDYCMKADEIRLIKGRLKFEDDKGNPQGSAPFPSSIIIFRKKRKYDYLHVSSYDRD